jgi:hypothetical protein
LTALFAHDPWAEDTVENMLHGYFESIGRMPLGLATEGRCGVCGGLYEPPAMAAHLDDYAAEHTAERVWQEVNAVVPAYLEGLVADLTNEYDVSEHEVWSLLQQAAAVAARAQQTRQPPIAGEKRRSQREK